MGSSLLIVDQYTLAELQARYKSEDTKARIRSLKNLYRDVGTLPFEIAVMAVSDENCEVRRWMAKNASNLDYSRGESVFDNNIVPVKWNAGIVRTGAMEANGASSIKNLRFILERDSDFLVRALAKANGNIYSSLGDEWMGWFSQSSDLERLALIRNPNVAKGQDLIEKIFDPSDTTLGITQELRKQLCWAFLFNKEGVEWAGRYYGESLLESLSKWKKLDVSNLDLVYCGYRNIDAGDEARAKIYKGCSDDILRIGILEGCPETSLETIELALADSAPNCREFAYSKSIIGPERFKSALSDNDKPALNGLAQNLFLGHTELEEVRDKLFELGDHDGAWRARSAIERLGKGQPPQEASLNGVRPDLSQILTLARWILAGVAVLVLLRIFR